MIGPIEDGFSAPLTEATAAALCTALVQGARPFELRPANTLGLRLQWSGEVA
jgi:hypothetical protein